METLRKKIAQMLIMGFSGLELSQWPRVQEWLHAGLGGVILFDQDLFHPGQNKNLASMEQIRRLTTSLQTVAYQANPEHPLLIALDYEGGDVDRLKTIPGAPTTLSPKQQAQLSIEDQNACFHQMATTLAQLGFNLNFAPVVDLALDGLGGIIGQRQRSFSDDPHVVMKVAQNFVQVFRSHGIITCYKHFPGHGSACGDSHLGFVDVTQQFVPQELEPYRHFTDQPEACVDMIMTAHVINRQLDPSGVPATLSHQILTELLREELHFPNVLISDDLQMKAIADHYTLENALQLTIQAGADMFIFGNQWGTHDAIDLIDIIARLVESGDITEQRIEQSYRRIQRLKSKLNLRKHEAIS